MFASPPALCAPSFAIYQGDGGDEGGGRRGTPHTAEQPAAAALDGAVSGAVAATTPLAATPPLRFGYARRAMALALGPNPDGGGRAAAAAALV